MELRAGTAWQLTITVPCIFSSWLGLVRLWVFVWSFVSMFDDAVEQSWFLKLTISLLVLAWFVCLEGDITTHFWLLHNRQPPRLDLRWAIMRWQYFDWNLGTRQLTRKLGGTLGFRISAWEYTLHHVLILSLRAGMFKKWRLAELNQICYKCKKNPCVWDMWYLIKYPLTLDYIVCGFP